MAWNGRCVMHGGGWLVSMQHFCLHDCAAFAIWYVLAIRSLVVALCAFCDALTIVVTRIFVVWKVLLWWNLAKQAPTMHALHIGLCLHEKVRQRE